MTKDSTGLLYTLFANLLAYPAESTFPQAQSCLELVEQVDPEAARQVKSFQDGLKSHSLQQMQELYTVTFDMQPVCYPYVGYQLFGENYKRGAFMAQLNEAYHAGNYCPGKELPDNISVILHFLAQDAANRESEFCRSLLLEGVLPALEKMLKSFGKESENPYYRLLTSLYQVLAVTPEKELSHA